MDPRRALAVEHLALRLRPLHRALRDAVGRRAALSARLARPDLTALCVTPDHVSALLDDVEQAARPLEEAAPEPAEALRPRDEERAAEEVLRARARAWGCRLPLDELSDRLGLDAFEQDAILLCAAPELDAAYERIYGFILDDLSRRLPCVELLAGLAPAPLAEQLSRRSALGPLGKLRRCRVLEAAGEAPTALRQELCLSALAREHLFGGEVAVGLLRDPAEVPVPEGAALPPDVPAAAVARIAGAMRGGWISLVGVWGPPSAGREEVVLALAAGGGRALRRAPPCPAAGAPLEPWLREAREAVEQAAALGAILWISTDALAEHPAEAAREALVGLLEAAAIPAVLSGIHPLRPPRLLELRGYTEIALAPSSYAGRRALWSEVLADLDPSAAADLAARYRLGPSEVRATERLARTEARLAGNGRPAPVEAHVGRAAGMIARQRSEQFATAVTPRRTAGDLVLPPDLHRQVIEVGAFYRAWPRAAEAWGFGRIASGGMKALFTGDPGTGKTLSAEVIAGELGLVLLKVDLARVVSKWVGETEKNLEAAFREAEQSHAVLLFDEAEALFGKRGEVERGSDRYANLEVSYLLQRIEAYEGLCILASNLKDQIDEAFLRRFHVVLHFPRPRVEERRRLWSIAFPPSAPLDPGVDLSALTRLDLTGAGIVGVARLAALLALSAGRERIEMRDVVRAIARQYRREARVLNAGELGPYAGMVSEA